MAPSGPTKPKGAKHAQMILKKGPRPREIVGKSQEHFLKQSAMFWSFLWKACLNDRFRSSGKYSASIWCNEISICSWERPKLLISMISGFLNPSPSPNPTYFYLWSHKGT